LIKEIVKTGAKFDKCIAGKHFIQLINNTSGIQSSNSKHQSDNDKKFAHPKAASSDKSKKIKK
jgi:hypothetical protein